MDNASACVRKLAAQADRRFYGIFMEKKSFPGGEVYKYRIYQKTR